MEKENLQTEFSENTTAAYKAEDINIQRIITEVQKFLKSEEFFFLLEEHLYKNPFSNEAGGNFLDLKYRIDEIYDRIRLKFLEITDQTSINILNLFQSLLTEFINGNGNIEIERAGLIEFIFLYFRIKNGGYLDKQTLGLLLKIITLLINARTFNKNLDIDFQEKLKEFLAYSSSTESILARTPPQSGEHSMTNYLIMPPLINFSQEEPFISNAFQILENMQEHMNKFLIRLTNFEYFFIFIREIYNNGRSADVFLSICDILKEAFYREYDWKKDEMLLNLKKIETQKILAENYMQNLKKHFDRTWDEIVFPTILVFAKLLFGK
jgi:hypothetical protein